MNPTNCVCALLVLISQYVKHISVMTMLFSIICDKHFSFIHTQYLRESLCQFFLILSTFRDFFLELFVRLQIVQANSNSNPKTLFQHKEKFSAQDPILQIFRNTLSKMSVDEIRERFVSAQVVDHTTHFGLVPWLPSGLQNSLNPAIPDWRTLSKLGEQRCSPVFQLGFLRFSN